MLDIDFGHAFFFKYEIKFCVSALVKRYPAVYLIQFQTQGLFMFILEVKWIWRQSVNT